MSVISIELPEAVHQKAKALAQQTAMPLERLVVVALIEKLAAMFPDEKLEAHAHRGSDAGFDEFMNGVPDVEPESYDRLPPK